MLYFVDFFERKVYNKSMLNDITASGRVIKDALSLNNLYYSGYDNFAKGEYVFESGPFITLLFAESGNFSINHQGSLLAVKESCFAFLPPSTPCRFFVKGLTARVFVCKFTIASKIPLDLFDNVFFASGLKLPLLKRLARSSSKIFPQKNTDVVAPFYSPVDEHTVKNCLELLLIECVKPADKSIIDGNYPISGKGEGSKTASKIYEYLTKNVHRNVSLEEVADELFFSVSYVKTTFKKHTGKSIIQVFNELKIKRAKKLIKRGESFSQIASGLGFTDQRYFSRVFKHVTGMTPTEYKKTLIK